MLRSRIIPTIEELIDVERVAGGASRLECSCVKKQLVRKSSRKIGGEGAESDPLIVVSEERHRTPIARHRDPESIHGESYPR